MAAKSSLFSFKDSLLDNETIEEKVNLLIIIHLNIIF